MANAKKYDDLTFTDDFMFCKVMTTNPELCHELLELILGKKVGAFTRLDQQKPIEMTADGKGIRFDVYSEDDSGIVYDCEMQTSKKDNLPKRTRYYQGMIDLNLLERGADYKELKKSYVIFICPFDQFQEGLHKYTFENQCKEIPELVLVSLYIDLMCTARMIPGLCMIVKCRRAKKIIFRSVRDIIRE